MRTVGRAVVVLALVLTVAVTRIFITLAGREDQSILGECGGPDAQIATALSRGIGFLPLLLLIVVVVALLGAGIYLAIKN